MVLKLKNRAENPRKKILIYGLDGTGKSTYAEQYCRENNLNPVVIDVDDTNFTGLDILDLKFANDMQTYNVLKSTIKEIGKSDYDTIIIDGVSSLLEMLTSKAKGMAAYSDRAKRWNDLLFEIENTRKNVIFIGQIDCDMLWTEDYQPSKAIIKVNSLVNEKYECFISEKGGYEVKVKKFRTLEQIEAETSTPSSSGFETAKDYTPKKTKDRTNAERLLNSLQSKGVEITLENAKKELAEKIQKNKFSPTEANGVYAEVEVLLNGS